MANKLVLALESYLKPTSPVIPCPRIYSGVFYLTPQKPDSTVHFRY